MSEPVTCTSTDGLRLEGLVDEPPEPRGVVVVCHPHPRAGGTMNAPLLDSVIGALVRQDLACVRFNFRGIGESEGESAYGLDEVADARGAVAFARDRYPGLPVALLGWSFGAGVAIRAATEDDGFVAVVAITPAVDGREGYTEALPTSIHLAMPVTVIAGANDKTTDPSRQEEWARANGARFVKVKGANHFFWAKYDDLNEAVVGALREAFA